MEKNKHILKSKLIRLFLSRKKKIAIEVGNVKISYLDLVKKILSISKKLKNNGLMPGAKILIDLDNSEEFIYYYFGCFLNNYTIIPISNKFTVEEKNKIISLSFPNVIVSNKGLKKVKNVKFKKPINSKKALAIFYTSGTTSEPKGVCHEFKTLIDNALTFNKHVKIGKNIRFLHFLPMGYMAGFLNSILSPLLTGGTLIIKKKFNAFEMFNLINTIIEKKIDTIWLIPNMINYLNDLKISKKKKNKFKKVIKNIFVGTAPYHDDLKKNFYKKFKIQTFESYGMTEILLISSNARHFKNIGSGKLLPNVQCKKIDNEIYFKTNNKFLGYVKNNKIIPNKTLWFQTGDLGSIKDKYLLISGRSKNIIIKNGINISPIMIENLIIKITKVEKCYVTSKEINSSQTQIIAYLQLKNIYEKKHLVSKLKKKMPALYLPEKIYFVRKFKLNHIGKINIKKS